MSTTVPEWRKQFEEALAAAIVVARASERAPRLIPAATVALVARLRATVAAYKAEADEHLRHVRAAAKRLAAFETKIIDALRQGTPISSTTDFDLSVHDRPKRLQWGTEGVQRLIEHLQTEVAKRTEAPMSDLFNYDQLLRLAGEQGWIGGTCAELQVVAKQAKAATEPPPRLVLTRLGS